MMRRRGPAAPRPGDAPPRTVGILGAGRMGALHALAARTAGLRVVEVASRDRASAERLATECGAEVVEGAGSYRRAEVVVVCTPTDRHAEHLRTLLSTGRDVLVEVPALADADEVEHLAAAADASGRLVRVAEHLAHAPLVRAAMRHRSRFGPATHLLVRTPDDLPSTRHHAIWLALLLAGEPCVASARDGSGTRLTFASGLAAELRPGGGDWDAELATDDGVVRLGLSPQLLLEVNGEEVEVPLRRAGVEPRLELLGFLDQLSEVCTADAPPDQVPGVPLAAAAEVLRLL